MSGAGKAVNLCAGNYFKSAQPVRVATIARHISSVRCILSVRATFSWFTMGNLGSHIRPATLHGILRSRMAHQLTRDSLFDRHFLRARILFWRSWCPRWNRFAKFQSRSRSGGEEEGEDDDDGRRARARKPRAAARGGDRRDRRKIRYPRKIDAERDL